MKAIILTAGNATRLKPITDCYGKVLVPIYDKPMIDYGISLLFGAGIEDIAIVCNKKDYKTFKELFDNEIYKGKVKLYIQKQALGTANAIKYAKKFVKDDDFVLLFGDNIFVMKDMGSLLKQAIKENQGMTLFAKQVSDPQRFGVVEFSQDYKIIGIEEKPSKPKTNYAAVGLYICDNMAMKKIETLQKSPRGEYEFTDVIQDYVKSEKAKVCILPDECKYLDTGTFDSLLECSILVKEFEKQNGLLACKELELFRAGKINEQEFEKAISHYAKDYKDRIKASMEMQNKNEV